MTIRLRTTMIFRAWRYDPAAPIPIWVARKFHRLGSDEVLQSANGLKVRPGDWCMKTEDSGKDEIGMMTADEYRELVEERRYFEVMPDEAPEGYEL